MKIQSTPYKYRETGGIKDYSSVSSSGAVCDVQQNQGGTWVTVSRGVSLSSLLTSDYCSLPGNNSVRYHITSYGGGTGTTKTVRALTSTNSPKSIDALSLDGDEKDEVTIDD